MNRKIKHLEFLQGVINRLSTNSFLLKGWSVVLIVALFVISTKESNKSLIVFAYVPAMIFWGLDGYFLWLERMYRVLYDFVRAKEPDEIDFSMRILDVGSGVKDLLKAIFSKTLIFFHGILVVLISIVISIQG